ncbi:MAG TPA: molybdopterin-binding protein [Micropepsaceae bacterium]|jgi:DMSO/TMAO reductase YedYZ molybdopterin-dependent catalytic subunit|nr:molybdopterin-binding protein [Micropepsaceae bacterium]
MSLVVSRRQLLSTGAAAAGSALLAGCDRIPGLSTREFLDFGQLMSMRAQRLLLASQPLVREYALADISPDFPPNGTEMPDGAAYVEMIDSQFANWRLTIDGLVSKPLSLSLDEIKRLPVRTQVTQHSCDEGWSAIGQWTGVPLAPLLVMAGLRPEARFIVFHCLDEMTEGEFYYESIDLFDAFHPQTILAYGMNGKPLPVAHGAPLRLRVERQIGYKNAKYVTRVEAVDGLSRIGGGRGGFWPDHGYQWYAGL